MTGPAEPAIVPAMRVPRSAKSWGLRLSLLALLVQAAAAAVPMPASAGMPGAPAWLAASLCQSAPADAPGDRRAPPSHLICPICFVLSAAVSAVPPQPPAIVAFDPPPAAPPAIPRALGLSRHYAGATTLSRAPPTV